MNQLTPPPAPIGIFPGFIAKQTETLVLKGHYVGGSYDVSTIDGRQFLSVKAEGALLSHRKYVYGIEDTHLCTIRRETWTIPDVSLFYQKIASWRPRIVF
jgi:hypothetical protein